MRAVALLALCLVLTACSAGGSVPGAASTRDGRAPVPSPSASASAGSEVGAVRAPALLGEVEVRDASPESLEQLRSEPPQSLQIDSLGIDMTVADVGLAEDGSMEIPASAAVAGWYRFGPAPGAASGNAVLAAHVDDPDIGLGPFASLKDLGEGDGVTVTTASGDPLDFTVTRVERTSKREVDMSLVFSRDGEPQLVLVTCGGRFDWDTGHYEDNVVVYATPSTEPAA
ncbi:class F sortase [Demequina activiva]|uniref:Sortase family protein n=1 Tax=Demequina activiva TaxID=1582364 RepID=A0A919Q494_9MICO|nr:class F sortase [Demequina activiva]GIG54932.1 hypothetical protein Dac01nite_16840 [Demequina activiva]